MDELTKEQAMDMLRRHLEAQDSSDKPNALEALRDLLNEVRAANRYSVVENNTTTPLHEAAGAGDLERVRQLLELGADVNAQQGIKYDYKPYEVGGHNWNWQHPGFPGLGLTPLGRCFTDYNRARKYDLMTRLEIAELLMEHGASANVPYQQTRSVFIHMIELCHEYPRPEHLAISREDQERLTMREKLLKLIEQALIQDENRCGGVREYLMVLVARFCGLSIYKDPARTSGYGEPTRLDHTLYRWQQGPHPFDVCNGLGTGDGDIMEVLLKHGFRVDETIDAMPPLFTHASDNHFVDFLVEHGADVNQVYRKRTPLLYLLSDDFKPCEDSYFCTSLRFILSASDHLVELGADINAVGPDGVSAKELYQRRKAQYQRELDSEPDWEAVARQEEERRSLQGLLDEYGGDEDAMYNSQEYWDYMEDLPDLD